MIRLAGEGKKTASFLSATLGASGMIVLFERNSHVKRVSGLGDSHLVKE